MEKVKQINIYFKKGYDNIININNINHDGTGFSVYRGCLGVNKKKRHYPKYELINNGVLINDAGDICFIPNHNIIYIEFIKLNEDDKKLDIDYGKMLDIDLHP